MDKDIGVVEEDVDEYLSSIAASGVLRRSKWRTKLIEHLLLTELRGEGDRLKAYSTAIDVFERTSEFDPSSDSIVRVEVGRLRSALDLFEASEHATTRIHVSIPVGTYQPVITQRHQEKKQAEKEVAVEAQSRISSSGLLFVLMTAFIVLAFGAVLLTQTSLQPTPLAIGVQVVSETKSSETEQAAAAVRIALSRAETIKVLTPPSDSRVHQNARFLVTVSVHGDQQEKSVSTKLTSVDKEQFLWAKTITLGEQYSLQNRIEAELAGELRVRLFGASKEILELRKPEELSSEELFVMATWVPGVHESSLDWERKRIELASFAVERDPNYGAAHSVLADKLAYLANVHAPEDTVKNRNASVFHSRRAMELDPLNPDVVFNVSLSHWHNGNIAESMALTKRVLELDSGHDIARFLLIVTPYTCDIAPDEALERAKAFDANLSVDNPIRWVTLNWIGWLQAYRGEWQEALASEEAAARIFQIPYTFMRRAVILNALGRTDEAKEILLDQSSNWPGFDPHHFANTTIPTLCSEANNGAQFVQLYESLAENLIALD